MGNPDDAAKQFARVLALDSRHAEAHYNLGLLQKERGQADAANQHFARALEINPDFEEARRNLDYRGQINEVGSGNAEV